MMPITPFQPPTSPRWPHVSRNRYMMNEGFWDCSPVMEPEKPPQRQQPCPGEKRQHGGNGASSEAKRHRQHKHHGESIAIVGPAVNRLPEGPPAHFGTLIRSAFDKCQNEEVAVLLSEKEKLEQLYISLCKERVQLKEEQVVLAQRQEKRKEALVKTQEDGDVEHTAVLSGLIDVAEKEEKDMVGRLVELEEDLRGVSDKLAMCQQDLQVKAEKDRQASKCCIS